jgi:hypothetical protein
MSEIGSGAVRIWTEGTQRAGRNSHGCKTCGDGPGCAHRRFMSLRVQLRRLLRSRVFVVTAVLVLGMGLGVNLTLFNTVYALLWRPLGFPSPTAWSRCTDSAPAAT